MQSISAKILLIVSCVMVMIAMVGCGSKVDQVKNGHFRYNSTVTVGKAFDSSFGNPEWKEDESAKGVKFVEFKGDIDVDFLDMKSELLGGENVIYAISLLRSMNGLKINCKTMADCADSILVNRFVAQFVFDDDGSTFNLGYIGLESRDGKDYVRFENVWDEMILKFIYSDHVYEKFDFRKEAFDVKKMAVLNGNFDESVVARELDKYGKAGQRQSMKRRLVQNVLDYDAEVIDLRMSEIIPSLKKWNELVKSCPKDFKLKSSFESCDRYCNLYSDKSRCTSQCVELLENKKCAEFYDEWRRIGDGEVKFKNFEVNAHNYSHIDGAYSNGIFSIHSTTLSSGLIRFGIEVFCNPNDGCVCANFHPELNWMITPKLSSACRFLSENELKNR